MTFICELGDLFTNGRATVFLRTPVVRHQSWRTYVRQTLVNSHLDPYSVKILYTGCAKMNLLRECFRTLSSDRQTSYAWSLPVMWPRWRSHHWIRHTRKRRSYGRQHRSLHCRNRNLRPFLRLWPWPWPGDLHIRTWPVLHRICKYDQLRSSYVKTFVSYRLTDIPYETDKLRVVTSGHVTKMAIAP